MLDSSVYNLFALIGRKVPFTHSLTLLFLCFSRPYITFFALLGRKAPFTHSFVHYRFVSSTSKIELQILLKEHFHNIVMFCFLFAAIGNPRGNENPFMYTFAILFFRWHNYLCKQLKSKHKTWNDERLFNEARQRVIAHHQVIMI